jgi:hypothetical protein
MRLEAEVDLFRSPPNLSGDGACRSDSWRERPSIERKFAEQKKCHGLRQARYGGLAKVQAMGTDPPGGELCPNADGER